MHQLYSGDTSVLYCTIHISVVLAEALSGSEGKWAAVEPAGTDHGHDLKVAIGPYGLGLVNV